MIDLWLDLVPFILFQTGNIDLIIKMANVADDRLILHLHHVVMLDDIKITRRGNKDIYLVAESSIFTTR